MMRSGLYTPGSLRFTGNKRYQEAFGPLILGVHHASINDINSVRSFINEKTAAIIIEPVQGEGEVHVYKKEFLQEIRNLCNQHDIVLILDEVQCGMARTRTYMTYFQDDILLDIV